uniref:Uncharacterized protein n=1 Tax=Tanacetum cinerariifolium TaxID=118510 RepID=A0A699I1H3_TANCI|nr:hypothetical protein [Tanacetum cinerariifolium]
MEMERQSLVVNVKARYTVDFVHLALRELEIHSLMIQLRILTMILQTLSTYHHNPKHNLVSYVEMIIITILIVYRDSRLTMSRNRATIKTLVIIIIHKIHQVFHNNTFVVRTARVLMRCSSVNRWTKISIILIFAVLTNFNPRKKFDYISFGERPMALLLAHERFFKIKKAFREEQHQPENIQELLRKLLNDFQVLNRILPERGEHAAQIKNFSNEITPDLPTKEPDNSLSIRDEPLDTILETESDVVIKYSVEDLIPIPIESEGISDDTCDVPFCDNSPLLDVLNDHFEIFSDFNDDCTSCEDFSSINFFEEKSVTFSNPLFNSNDDFTSSDDESLSDEDVLEDNVKIYSNPIFEFNDEYISSDVNPLFDEVLEYIECKDSYDSNLDELTFLVTPLFDVNEDEYFTPGDDVELLRHRDPSTPIMNRLSKRMLI